MIRLAVIVLAWLLATAAAAEIYRCPDADGGLHFTSDPRVCPGAEAHTPDPGRVTIAPSGASASAPDSGPAAPVAVDSARLAELLPPAPRGWQATDEAVAVERDAALRAQGLLASVARHYDRARGAVSEVCTVEIWSFASPERARAAHASLDLPREWSRPSGALLVLARGIHMERDVGSRRELVPGCRDLAESVEARDRAPR